MARGRGLVDRVHHALILLRTGDGEHIGEPFRDGFGFGPHAAGDDDLAIVFQGRPDGGEQFRLGAVEEPAGVDDDQVGPVMPAGQFITLRAQLRDDTLRIDQRLGAAERDEADRGRRRGRRC